MDVRFAALAIATLTLASAAAVAPLYVHLFQGADAADHVTLYENGLAAISLVRGFTSDGGAQVLSFQLPTTALFETVTVAGEDVAVAELRSALSAKPLLEPGDSLVVHLDDKSTLSGTLVARQDGSLLLATGGGSTLVQEAHVTAIEVSGRPVDPRATGTTEVTVKVTAAAGPRSVRVSYLAQGTGWEPHYQLDAATGQMTFFARLTGLQDWSNVTLDLVSGNPSRVYAPSLSHVGSYTFARVADSAGAPAPSATYAPPVGPSESLGDLHRYHYGGTVTLARGEEVRLPLVAGHADVLRHYYTAMPSRYSSGWTGLAETYRIRNALGEPLPAGRIDVSLGGEWVGSDTIGDLGRSEETNVTAAHSGDVKARVQAIDGGATDPTTDQYGHRTRVRTTTYVLQVRNLRGDAADTRLGLDVGGSRVLSVKSHPAPSEEQGNLKIWDRVVAAGETVSYTVTEQHTEDV